MDLKRLTTFVLVAKRGNLQKAADELKLTIPTISVQLKTLEKELKAKLFHHTPNKLILTPQGKRFVQKAEAVLSAVERATASVSNEEDDFVGHLSVSIGNDIVRLIAPSIAAFIKQHRLLEITLLARRPPESLSLILNGEIDLAMGRFRSLPRGIFREKLMENGLAAVFSSNHPLGRKETLSLEDLAACRIITLTRNSQTRKTIDSVFRKNSIEPQNILEVGTCQSAVEFAKLGVGIALVHDICVVGELKAKLRSINMSREFGKTPISIIYKKSAILTAAHHALIKILRSNSESVSRLL